MSTPPLPSRRPPAGLPPGRSRPIPPKPNPPIAGSRGSVSEGIAKRWPPLAKTEPPQLPPSRKSPEQAPSTPDTSAPPLPKRPAEPVPTASDYIPPLPTRPAADHPPPLPASRRPTEPLPPSPSQAQASTPVIVRPRTPVFAARTPAPMANGDLGADLGPDSFGKCLQGATEAIGKRHEDELIALESLRFHVFNRAKQDKAYAEELLKTNTRASKKASMVSNSSSPIFKAWQAFLEMSEQLQKQIQNGSAQMSTVLLSTVDQLIRDKRGAKTVFDRELAKIDKEKKESCSKVTELKTEYRHHVKKTETFKTKLEASLAKDPPKPQEQDRARKKFVGSADKLHATHNEYCLSILNANRHMEHHRLSLTPFTLDTLQERMQLQIGQWKEAMMNYAKAMDLTQTYQECYEKLYESLNTIDHRSEYSSFIEEHKEEDPPLDFFMFESGLLESQVSPKVEAGMVVINNLTHATMKARLTALEEDLEKHLTEIQQKTEELKELTSSIDEDDSLISSPTLLSPNKDSPQQPPKHVQIATLNATVREMECLQARKQEQATLIKEGVEALGADEAPLFDPLGEGVDAKELAAAGAAESAADGGASRTKTLAWGSTMRNMKSAGSKLKKFFGKKKRDHSVSVSSNEESALKPSESRDTIASSEGGGYESDDSADVYDEPPDIPVEEEEWYFGDIDRRLAESKCKNEGDYLVRHSERQKKYVLTCKYKGISKHFVIQVFTDDMTGENQYRFESKAFSKIRFLLDYHTSSHTPVTRASGAIIINSISKYDKWELQRDEIKMGKKIGKGAFGDVFEAHLRDNRKVAVKTCRSSDFQDMEKFLQEADILKGYQHPNIVSLIGVCSQKDQVYIVMEFMPGGSFLEFLRKKGVQQTKKKLCAMVIDAAKGMTYLEEQHCIHRDLAARNCLVGDEDIVKIADFGMSRESEDSEYTVQSGTRAIPIKWTAPEALNYGKYTPASDVWSFGILLWETYSCGSSPYPGISNKEAQEEVENGYRMSPPADCPQEVYGVMQQCWQYDPEERPDFKTVLDMLEQANEKIKN